MLPTNIRRILSLLLACSVVLSTVPFPVLANEALVSQTPELIQIEENTPADPIDENTTILNKKAEITLPEQLDSRIAILLEKYGITAETNDEEIASAIIAVDGETLQITMEEIHAINEAGHAFTSEEHQYMDEQRVYTYFRFCNVLDQLMTPALLADCEIDGIKISHSGGSLNYNSDTKTATATITGSALVGFEWTSSQTLTLKNTTSNDISLSFNYAVQDHTSLKINGESISDKGGSKSIDLAANNGSFKIVLESPKGKKTATLTLTGFKLTIKKPKSAVTIFFDQTLCSVTAAGLNVETSGTVKENISETDGIVLNTSAIGNSTFLGWVNAETHTIVSKTPNFTYYPIEDTSVEPIYSTENACFRIGSSYLFNDLNDATATAISGSTIVPVNDGIIPAGNYTIPKDVTLLIPFDDADTLCKTAPIIDVTHDLDIGYVDTYTAKAHVQPTAYRTLTMANGANITVNGAISLSSKQCANQTYNGHPTGPTSFLNMNEGSHITVNNGGSLYAWGYIMGSGTITVESGGIVYEDFQLTNWRGGTASTDMISDYAKETYDTFPINQYYIQNVEVPMTLKAGAKEYGHVSVVASSILGAVAIEFIGPSGLFRMGTGATITKKYQGSTDRLIIDTTGSLSLSALVVGLSGYNMNSSEYVLPVTSNFTVNIKNGTATVGEDMAFLPGVEMNIQEGASLTIAEGKKLFVYDGDNWDNYAYEGRKFAPVVYTPSRPNPNPRTDASLVDAKITIAGTLDASKGSIYTPNGTANFVGVNGGKFIHPGGSNITTYQALQTGTDIEFVGIDAPPVELLIGENKTSKSMGAYVFDGTYWKHQDHKGGTASCKDRAVCTLCGEPYGSLLDHTYVDHEAKIPTLKEAGHTAYQTCEHCDYTTYTALKAARVGETEYTVLQDALNAAGNGGTLTLLSDISGEIPVSQNLTILTGGFKIAVTTDSSYYATPEQDNTIKVWKLIGFYGTNIAVQDSLDINFFLDGSLLKTDGNYTAKITRTKYTKGENGAYTKPETTTLELSKDNWTARGQYFVFTYAEIAAKEMTDAVTVQIFEDGHPISIACQESVVSYAHRTLDKNPDNSELRTVLVDMLNYGTAAQKHFGYQTSVLANKDLTEAEQQEATKNVLYTDNHVIDKNGLFAADTVTLESNLIYSFYFDFTEAMTGDYALVSYQNAYGKNFTDIRIDNFRSNGIYSCVDVKELAIGDGYQIISCKVYDSNDTLIAECSSSIESYLALNINQNNSNPIYMSMMKFIQSAYNYFH